MPDSSTVLEDLAASGFEVPQSDLWTFVPKGTRTWKEAVPVLVRHLKPGEYPEKTIAALAALLARKESVPYWSDIVEAYKKAPAGWAKGALAGTLAATSRKQNVDSLAALFKEYASDRSVISFVRPLLKLDPKTYAPFFEANRDNAVYGVEATSALKRQSRNEN